MYRYLITTIIFLSVYINDAQSREIKEKQDFNDITASLASGADHLLPGKINRFVFRDWAGPSFPAWVYIPSTADPKTAPILVMMHGAKRGAHRYLKEWQPLAQKSGIIVIAPEFSREGFPGSRRYNLGYVFDKKTGIRGENLWTFSSIEPLFDKVVEAINGEQTNYTMFGHSAGSQFVHRYLYYKPKARVKRYIAANAGWYTSPDMNELYPYGLKKSGVPDEHLKAALSKDVVILLGDKDTNSTHKSLRRTPEAMQQGKHRFARGLYFYQKGLKQANNLHISYGWTTRIIEGVAHSNSGMARGAIDLVE